jgi:alkanesulfonate monooxygenase
MNAPQGRLRFHWRLLQPGSTGPAVNVRRVSTEAALPDLDAQLEFCHRAELSGIDSVLVDVNLGKPDPMTLALALGRATSRLTFMVAHRAGMMSPTLFVQQVNTFSMLTDGRISLNMVAGHSPAELRCYGDALSHDDRYLRLAEYLGICRRFWSGGGKVNVQGRFYTIVDGELRTPFLGRDASAPEIFVGGSSNPARDVAARHADCWMRFADTPERISEEVRCVVAQGIQVGLRLSVIARPTRIEALAAARSLMESASLAPRQVDEKAFVSAADSASMKRAYELADEEWLTPCLWTGAVRTLGATAMALVGSFDEVARGIMEFKEAGVSQFILLGWPSQDEMTRFGRDVLPVVRKLEGGGR